MSNVECFVVGDEAVGKNHLILSYLDKDLYSSESIIFDNYCTTFMVENIPYTLTIRKASGVENYDNIRSVLYDKTDVFLVCFSVVSQTSFDNVKKKWFPEILKFRPDVPCLIVGTQIDRLQEQSTLDQLEKKYTKPITEMQGRLLAKELKAYKYVQCSAITKKGVKKVFEEAIIAALGGQVKEKKNNCVIV